MNQILNLSSSSGVLAVDEVAPVVVRPRESRRSATGAKSSWRMRPAVWGAEEWAAITLVSFYVFAVGALSAAVLLYTFNR